MITYRFQVYFLIRLVSRVSSNFIVVGVVCVIGEIFQSSEILLLLVVGCGVGHGLHILLFVCLGDGVAIGAGADLSLSSSSLM